MQFTDEVDWNLFDFFIAALLLFGTGTLCNFTLIKFRNNKYKIPIIIIILILSVLIWAELSVGIFETSISVN